MKRVRAVLDALLDFARGFLGLRVTPPRDSESTRRELEARARQPRCC